MHVHASHICNSIAQNVNMHDTQIPFSIRINTHPYAVGSLLMRAPSRTRRSPGGSRLPRDGVLVDVGLGRKLRVRGRLRLEVRVVEVGAAWGRVWPATGEVQGRRRSAWTPAPMHTQHGCYAHPARLLCTPSQVAMHTQPGCLALLCTPSPVAMGPRAKEKRVRIEARGSLR